jgi:hypothetical protein
VVPHLLGDLRRLAHETYLELNLGSLIRLDVRADASGKLHVLEANPKPDLKKPAAGVTSLIAAGLPGNISESDFRRLQETGCILVDTTCGSVLNVWKRVEQYARDGYEPYQKYDQGQSYDQGHSYEQGQPYERGGGRPYDQRYEQPSPRYERYPQRSGPPGARSG